MEGNNITTLWENVYDIWQATVFWAHRKIYLAKLGKSYARVTVLIFICLYI